jgi:hypothetical protein
MHAVKCKKKTKLNIQNTSVNRSITKSKPIFIITKKKYVDGNVLFDLFFFSIKTPIVRSGWFWTHFFYLSVIPRLTRSRYNETIELKKN